MRGGGGEKGKGGKQDGFLLPKWIGKRGLPGNGGKGDEKKETLVLIYRRKEGQGGEDPS